jgi:ABC-type transport system involved in multi-copper enzyme maturation permease subunit
MVPRTRERLSGLVWIISSLALFVYGFLTLQEYNVPGVEQIVTFVSGLDSEHLYLAAFISIGIEGLYVIGNFFPGATLVVILSILSQTGGPLTFFYTIGATFLGWSTAGAINIFVARVMRRFSISNTATPDHIENGNSFITWYPAFGANHEFAQSLNGAPPLRAFLKSSLRKLVVCGIMLGILSIVPLFIDVREIDNTEGSISIFLFASISLVIGVRKFQTSRIINHTMDT